MSASRLFRAAFTGLLLVAAPLAAHAASVTVFAGRFITISTIA